jgi:hypothetical protein
MSNGGMVPRLIELIELSIVDRAIWSEIDALKLDCKYTAIDSQLKHKLVTEELAISSTL